ncbi:MAG TPA: lipase family protein [Candidatus Sulfotelmatobacter sp.]|nr:lipase family protein [Candidatus Sulfotelmatobacter sp.]
MDLNQAILYGQAVNAAYAIDPGDTNNRAGKNIPVGAVNYTVVTSIFANDLATDMNPARGQARVSIGLILQAAAAGDVIIAIRGTEGIQEWIHDAEFLLVPCPFLAGAGHTEDGFTEMYLSMTTGVPAGSPTVVKALPALAFPRPVTSLTICGHSLGGALATLLALDVAANTGFKNPLVYTYASPRTGGPQFAATYNQVVPNTSRIAGRIDLVPKLPLPPLYEHVNTLYDLNSVQLGLPPRILVKPDLICLHILTSYLFLLTRLAGGAVLPLQPACVP